MFISYLVSGITAADSAIEVPDGSIFPQNQVFDIWIDQEKMTCDSFVSANVINVHRGHDGTEVVAHDAGALIAIDESFKQVIRTIQTLDIHDIAALSVHGVGTAGFKLNSKIIVVTKDLTDADTSTAYTGAGFKPTGLVALGITDSTYGSLGIVDSAGTEKGIKWAAVPIITDTIAVLQSGIGKYQTASFASFDDDGFTLNWVITSTPTGTAYIYVLCVR